MMNLTYFENEYTKIMNKEYLTDYAKNYALARLMSEMEGAFHIPFLNDDEFNARNKSVMKLYLLVSNSRIL